VAQLDPALAAAELERRLGIERCRVDLARGRGGDRPDGRSRSGSRRRCRTTEQAAAGEQGGGSEDGEMRGDVHREGLEVTKTP